MITINIWHNTAAEHAMKAVEAYVPGFEKHTGVGGSKQAAIQDLERNLRHRVGYTKSVLDAIDVNHYKTVDVDFNGQPILPLAPEEIKAMQGSPNLPQVPQTVGQMYEYICKLQYSQQRILSEVHMALMHLDNHLAMKVTGKVDFLDLVKSRLLDAARIGDDNTTKGFRL